MIIPTTIGEAYIVTPVSLPLTIRARKRNGEIIELLMLDKPGQYAFVAPSPEVETDRDDAVVLETGFVNLSGSGTEGVHAPKGNYVRYKADGSVKQIHFPHLHAARSLLCRRRLAVPENGRPMELRLAGVADASGLLEGAVLSQNGPYPHLILRMPDAVRAGGMCLGCTGIPGFEGNFASLRHADGAFAGCTSLTYADALFPSLQSGFGMFRDCALEAEAINRILEGLPVRREGSRVITFTGCPGACGCNPDIAVAKGWTVEL